MIIAGEVIAKVLSGGKPHPRRDIGEEGDTGREGKHKKHQESQPESWHAKWYFTVVFYFNTTMHFI